MTNEVRFDKDDVAGIKDAIEQLNIMGGQEESVQKLQGYLAEIEADGQSRVLNY